MFAESFVYLFLLVIRAMGSGNWEHFWLKNFTDSCKCKCLTYNIITIITFDI